MPSFSNSTFSIELFCSHQPLRYDYWNNESLLAPSSISFLTRLNMSSIHPFCDPSHHLYSRPYDIDGIPPQGPLLDRYGYLDGGFDVLVTNFFMVFPALIALCQLWIRFLAFFIAPAGITYLLFKDINDLTLREDVLAKSTQMNKSSIYFSILCFFTTLSSAIMLTDLMYILEFGPQLGASLVVISMSLSWRLAIRIRDRSIIKSQILVFIMLFFVFSLDYYQNKEIVFGGKLAKVSFSEGLYYDKSNPLISEIVNKHWPNHYRIYDTSISTPWMVNGDSRTGFPFLLNKVPPHEFIRVWVPIAQDGEVIALDIRFPDNGYDPSQPVYLIYHGLMGGSFEEYVRDFIWRRSAESATVIVFIARGLMDLPIRSWNTFHGARWEDGHIASLVVKEALSSDQILAGVGFSMGGIVLANLISRTGSECALDVAIGISGGLDLRHEFERSSRLWNKMLMAEMRDDFILAKWGERVRARLSKDEMKRLMQSVKGTEIDEYVMVEMNGFDNLTHYRSEMSMLGDVPLNSHEFTGGIIHPTRRVHNISIPFCIIQALDDPIISWHAVASNSGSMSPSNLVKTGSGNLVLLLTRRGGHLGWPLGWWPVKTKWKWMNDAAMSFTNAVFKAKKEAWKNSQKENSLTEAQTH